jgi:hypothetical protein
VSYPIMHVTCMDHVDRRKGDNLTMHTSVMRERRQKAEVEGLVPRRRGGRARRADDDDELEPEPQVEDQMDMDMEHQVEDDAEEDVGDVEAEEDVDDFQQQRRRR